MPLVVVLAIVTGYANHFILHNTTNHDRNTSQKISDESWAELNTVGNIALEPKQPVHWHGSWIGNQWIPSQPSYVTYTPKMISRYFHQFNSVTNRTILFLGDSLARRQFFSFHALLRHANNTDITVQSIDGANVIDAFKYSHVGDGKRREYFIYRPMPNPDSFLKDDVDISTGGFMGYARIFCLDSLLERLSSSWFQQELPFLSLVVIAMGPWETGNRCERNYSRGDITRKIFQRIDELVQISDGDVRFVWRTWGGPAGGRNNDWKNAQAHNTLIKELVHTNQRRQWDEAEAYTLSKVIEHQKRSTVVSVRCAKWNVFTYIDWGMSMGPRIFPDETQIKGDIKSHYGLEPRIAFIQQLINHLVEIDRQERYGITPWCVAHDYEFGKGIIEIDTCARAGISEDYCLTQAELKQYNESFL